MAMLFAQDLAAWLNKAEPEVQRNSKPLIEATLKAETLFPNSPDTRAVSISSSLLDTKTIDESLRQNLSLGRSESDPFSSQFFVERKSAPIAYADQGGVMNLAAGPMAACGMRLISGDSPASEGVHLTIETQTMRRFDSATDSQVPQETLPSLTSGAVGVEIETEPLTAGISFGRTISPDQSLTSLSKNSISGHLHCRTDLVNVSLSTEITLPDPSNSSASQQLGAAASFELQREVFSVNEENAPVRGVILVGAQKTFAGSNEREGPAFVQGIQVSTGQTKDLQGSLAVEALERKDSTGFAVVIGLKRNF